MEVLEKLKEMACNTGIGSKNYWRLYLCINIYTYVKKIYNIGNNITLEAKNYKYI